MSSSQELLSFGQWVHPPGQLPCATYNYMVYDPKGQGRGGLEKGYRIVGIAQYRILFVTVLVVVQIGYIGGSTTDEEEEELYLLDFFTKIGNNVKEWHKEGGRGEN